MTKQDLDRACTDKKREKLLKIFNQLNEAGMANVIDYANIVCGVDKYRQHPRHKKNSKIIRADFNTGRD